MSSRKPSSISSTRTRRSLLRTSCSAAFLPAAITLVVAMAGSAWGLPQPARFAAKEVQAHQVRTPKRSHRRAQRPSGTRHNRAAAGPAAPQSKADCIYTANSIAVLASFEQLVGRAFDCALVFNNASPDWAGWEQPWFVNDPDPRFDWNAWTETPGAHRQLIITQNLFPSALNGTDWLDAGAAGAYVEHAKALARNLVAAGLGSSVIRLAHEANDTSEPYALPTSEAQLALWRQFWRKTVIAMRSVPGAHFLFDWCVNAYWRPIPLNEWYPGDDVVNIIGIDAYDAGVPPGEDRWTRLYTQPDGIREVLQFAAAHGKPASIPEWGLWSASDTGGGDDPSYIDDMASIVRNNRIAYQSYFYAHDTATLLTGASLAAYRRHFGAHGDSAGASTVLPSG